MTAGLPLFVAVPLAGAFVAPLLARRSAANDAPAARVLAVVIGTLLLVTWPAGWVEFGVGVFFSILVATLLSEL